MSLNGMTRNGEALARRARKAIPKLMILVLLALWPSQSASAQEGWESLGPFGNLDRELVRDPADWNVLYSLSSHEGVFKSTDEGISWRWMNNGYSVAAIYGTSALAISPTNPDELYFNVFHSDRYHTEVLGLYRSADAGESWQHVWTADEAGYVRIKSHIAVNPDGVLLANMEWHDGLWNIYSTLGRSTDSGVSWQPVLDSTVSVDALLFHPLDPDLAMLAGSNVVGTSTDAGMTWSFHSVPIPGFHRICWLQVSPQDPCLIYVASRSQSGVEEDTGGVFWSSDCGQTWERTGGIEQSTDLGVNFDCDPVRIYLNSRCSTDGGVTWQEYARPPRCLGCGFLFHPEDPSWVLHATTYDGIHSLLPDGLTWCQYGGGGSPSDLAISPQHPEILYVAAGEGGVYKSTDSGRTWRAKCTGLNSDRVWHLLMNPDNPDILYGYDDFLFKTADGAQSWRALLPRNILISYLIMDPGDPRILLAKGNDKAGDESIRLLLRSTDGGETWARVLQDRFIWGIAFHPHISGLVYLASSNPPLMVSTDSGLSWAGYDSSIPDCDTPDQLLFDPGDDGTLYCTSYWARGFRKSTDWGITWFNPCLDDPFDDLDRMDTLADPSRAGTLYCSNELNIYRTMEGAARWKLLARDLGHVKFVNRQADGGVLVYSVALRPETHDANWGLFRRVIYDYPPVILQAGFGATRLSASGGGQLQVFAIVRIFPETPLPVEAELCYEGIPTGIYLEDHGPPDPGQPQDHLFALLHDVSSSGWAGQYALELIVRDASGAISDRWPGLTSK